MPRVFVTRMALRPDRGNRGGAPQVGDTLVFFIHWQLGASEQWERRNRRSGEDYERSEKRDI